LESPQRTLTAGIPLLGSTWITCDSGFGFSSGFSTPVALVRKWEMCCLASDYKTKTETETEKAERKRQSGKCFSAA